MIVVVNAVQFALPRPLIEEGSNMLMVWEADNPLWKALPKPVLERMTADFNDDYPVLLRCIRLKVNCNIGPIRQIKQPYARSVETLWRPSTMSRTVDGIDINNVMDLRPSFMRDLRFRWARDNPIIDRNDPPYFVHYRIPGALAGSSICWKGNVFLKSGDAVDSLAAGDWQCRTIPHGVDEETVTEVIGYDTGRGDPLAISLELNPKWRASGVVRFLVPVLAAVLVARLLVGPVLRRFLHQSLSSPSVPHSLRGFSNWGS